MVDNQDIIGMKTPADQKSEGVLFYSFAKHRPIYRPIAYCFSDAISAVGTNLQKVGKLTVANLSCTGEGMKIINAAVLIVGATLLLGFVACGSGSSMGSEIPYKLDVIYYLSPVTEVEANRFLDWGVDYGVLDGMEPATGFQLRKVGEAYEVRVSLKDGILLETADPYMSEFACQARDNAFDGSEVEWVIIEEDTSFDKIRLRSLCLR